MGQKWRVPSTQPSQILVGSDGASWQREVSHLGNEIKIHFNFPAYSWQCFCLWVVGSSEGPDNSCWRVAYRQLASSCREIMANETKKVQLAVRFASCFLKASGRPGVRCSSWMSAGECTKQMSDHEHNIYLSFYLDVQDECHRIQ